MNEVKKPRKPLLYYYFVILIVILLFNALMVPYMGQSQVQDVDYGTFITMTEKHNVGKVQIEENQIIFTDKNEKNIYRTGVVNDPQLIERLYENGSKIYGDIEQVKKDKINQKRNQDSQTTVLISLWCIFRGSNPGHPD